MTCRCALPCICMYLYSSGIFILISNTEDTKYIPYRENTFTNASQQIQSLDTKNFNTTCTFVFITRYIFLSIEWSYLETSFQSQIVHASTCTLTSIQIIILLFIPFHKLLKSVKLRIEISTSLLLYALQN